MIGHDQAIEKVEPLQLRMAGVVNVPTRCRINMSPLQMGEDIFRSTRL